MTDPQSFDRFAIDYDRYVSLLPDQNTGWLSWLGLKGERALDAGCGSGIAAEVLAESFEYVVGVDLSRPLIEIAQSKHARPNIRYMAGDVLDLLDDQGFDLVYSHTMLHHLPDYRHVPGVGQASILPHRTSAHAAWRRLR